MQVLTHGKKENPKILLIHPSESDGTCFSPLYPFMEDYYLIMPTLNGHNLEDHSCYQNKQEEARQILDWLEQHGIQELAVLAGLSIGCGVAWEIQQSRTIAVRKMVLDGASFLRHSRMAQLFLYLSFLRTSQTCRKHPEKMNLFNEEYPGIGERMKQIAGHYSSQSLKNMVKDVMGGIPLKSDSIRRDDQIILIYGSRDPFIKSLRWFHKAGYPCREYIASGYGHCEYFCQKPSEYASLILNGCKGRVSTDGMKQRRKGTAAVPFSNEKFLTSPS